MRTFIILVAVAIIAVLLNSIFIVDQREQVLVLQFGEPVRVVKKPGLNFKIPMVQNIIRFDSRILDLNADPQEVIASDQKRLIVDSFVKYRISDALKFYQTVRTEDTARQRLTTFMDSSLREVLGSVPLSALLTGTRKDVMDKIQRGVIAKASKLGVSVVDVRIMRADLPKENSEAIYRRMQTEREREAKEFRAQGAEAAQRIRSRADRDRSVILAEAEKKSEILRGEGDAEATKIFADAFNKDQDFFAFYRSMQAYRKTLGNGDTRMILSPDSEFLSFFGESGGKNPR